MFYNVAVYDYVQSLYVEAYEPPLGMRRTRLSLQYGVKLMSNEVNPAYSAVFRSDSVATYEAKVRAIKPLGLRIERHLDEVGFHTHVIAPYRVAWGKTHTLSDSLPH